ncbi:uncharacterized protein [Aegilops tauschii subsp. strangulata]|nr:uncharacterized protein LOC109781026 [Aegilops tauschii subsp. strangulata]
MDRSRSEFQQTAGSKLKRERGKCRKRQPARGARWNQSTAVLAWTQLPTHLPRTASPQRTRRLRLRGLPLQKPSSTPVSRPYRHHRTGSKSPHPQQNAPPHTGRLHRGRGLPPLPLHGALPPWALIQRASVDESGAPASPRPSPALPSPPTSSTRAAPEPATASSSCASATPASTRTPSATSTPSQLRSLSWAGTDVDPEVVRFVCNPLTGELYRLPDLDGTKRTSACRHLGLLTQSRAGDGPPDRYAVAEMFTAGGPEEEGDGGFVMRRFLSETGKWDKVTGLPSPLPAGRKMDIGNAVVAFGDRLWWIDDSWGAISVDPLSDRPELRFVELPRGSVLPDLDGMASTRILGSHRRIGVSEGKMQYVEVSKEKPYVISLFSLDDEGSSWTLDHETAFAPIWDDALLCSAPLEQMLAIGAINPLKANIVYLACGDKILGVDVVTKKITRISGLAIAVPDLPLLPCVLPTWLESSQIPSAGWSKKNTLKSEVSPNTVKRENLHVEIDLLK